AVEDAAASAAMRRAGLMVFFYSSNWFLAVKQFPRPELAHAWSLSIEEQFYVAWPILLLLMLRMNWSRRAIAAVVAVAMVACAALRAWLWARTGSFERVYFGTDTHADGLLAGALGAMAASWGGIAPGSRAARVVTSLGLVMLGFLGFFLYFGWLADPW